MAAVPSTAKASPPYGTSPPCNGTQAEQWVAHRYRQQGWEILAQNYRRRGTELDLVAFKGGTVAFIEVKARKELVPLVGIVEALLPAAKQAALQRGAMTFLQENEGRLAWKHARFDLVVLALAPKAALQVLFFPDVLGGARIG